MMLFAVIMVSMGQAAYAIWEREQPLEAIGWVIFVMITLAYHEVRRIRILLDTARAEARSVADLADVLRPRPDVTVTEERPRT